MLHGQFPPGLAQTGRQPMDGIRGRGLAAVVYAPSVVETTVREPRSGLNFRRIILSTGL